MSWWDIFSNSNEDQARKDQIGGLNSGRNEAYKYLDLGLQGLGGQYGNALGYFKDLASTYGRGSRSYADALGLNGAQGQTRARSQFQTGPGYQFQQDQAAQAALRAGSAQGMLGSGNTSLALENNASQLANQEWGSYLDRLGGYDSKALAAAGAQAGISTGYGDAIMNANSQKANIGWNAETGIGQANANYELGKDRTSANIFGAITGGLSLGSKFLGWGM